MKTILIAMVILLAGCAWNIPSGQEFSSIEAVPDGKAVAYMYIPKKLDYVTGCTMIILGDVDSGCIGNPGYTKIILAPGEHSFKSRQKAALDINPKLPLFDFEFGSGKTYFFKYIHIDKTAEVNNALFRQDFSNEMFYVSGLGSAVWVEVDADEAISDLKGLTLWR